MGTSLRVPRELAVHSEKEGLAFGGGLGLLGN